MGKYIMGARLTAIEVALNKLSKVCAVSGWTLIVTVLTAHWNGQPAFVEVLIFQSLLLFLAGTASIVIGVSIEILRAMNGSRSQEN